TLLAGGLLWGWLAPWPKKAQARVRGGHAAPQGQLAEEEPDVEAEHVAHAAHAVLKGHEGVMAMFEAVPSAMLLDVDGAVTMATPQVGVMLGYFGPDAE